MQKRVLVVEDDEDDFILLQENLHQYADQFHLDWCTNVVTAIEYLQNSEFDACLIDYFLGTKTGFYMINKAVQMGFEGPLILLTGAPNREKIDEQALKVGADDYLSKYDISPYVLKRTLQYNIKRKQIQARIRLNESRAKHLAEISTNTLHNIGNVLTGLMIGSQSIEALINEINPSQLKKVASYIQKKELLRNHPNAKVVPTYLNEISNEIAEGADKLRRSIKSSLNELKSAELAIHIQQETMRGNDSLYNLSELLDEVVTVCRTDLSQEGVEVSITGGGGVDCSLERSTLLHVLINLVNNSISALRGRSQKKLYLKVILDEEWVNVELSDTGKKISEECLEKIFDRDFTAGKNGYNGVGLHFCYENLKRHGGTLCAQNKNRERTHFTIGIPPEYIQLNAKT